MSPPRQRADRLLVERGLFESRAKAQAAIEAGLVSANDALGAQGLGGNPGRRRLAAQARRILTSRAAASKLAAALDHFGFDPEAASASTSAPRPAALPHVLLNRGARRVYAVDVGRGQLHRSLRARPEVMSLEKTDIRDALPGPARRAAGFGHRRCQLHFAETGAACRARAGRNTARNWSL